MVQLQLPNTQLRGARERYSWSQEEVARRIEAPDRKTVGRWERGDNVPSRYYQQRLCELFGMSPEALGFVSEPESNPQSVETRIIDPLIPLSPPVALVGRDNLLAEIKQRLMSGNSVALAALSGLPGVGKTALAVAMAHDAEVRSHYRDGILWAGLGPEPNVDAILSRWGTFFDVSGSGLGQSSSREVWARALRERIGRRRMLVVIDDAWNLVDAVAFKIGGEQCAYILTTRQPTLAAEFALEGAMLVSELSSAQSVELLQRFAPEIQTIGFNTTLELVRTTGALPLALTLAGKYLHAQAYQRPPRRLHQAIDRLLDAKERLRLSEPTSLAEQAHPNLPTGTSLSLQSVIAVSDEHLDHQAQSSLRTLAIFPAKPNTFSEEAALAVSGVPVEVLDTLNGAGVLEISRGDRYTLHQAIADYARLSLEDEKALKRLITYYLYYVEKHSTEYEALELENNNVIAALEAAYKMEEREYLIRLICAFTPFLLRSGLYDLAAYHLQHALDMLPENVELQVHALLLLGQTAQKQGKYSHAVDLLQHGLVRARQLESAEWISAFLADLGWVTWKQGRYPLAEEYLHEGLELARQIGNNERICKFLRLLGAVNSSLGNYKTSVDYSQQGLELARRIGHSEHLCVLLIDYGTGLLENGDYLQAETFLREGLAVAQQIGHQEWSSLVFVNLSDLAISLQRYAQAAEYSREGLALARQIDHREWIVCNLVNLGIAARELGNYAEAEVSFQEAIDLALPLNRPFLTFMGWYEHTLLLIKQGQVEAAEALLCKCQTITPEGDRDMRSLWLFGMAHLAKARGDVGQALHFAEVSKANFAEMGSYRTKLVEQWLEEFQKKASGQ